MVLMNDKSSIFRKESLSELSSPRKLDDYIRVTHFSWWLVLVALAFFLIAGIIWASIGTIPETTSGQAVVSSKNSVTCYIPISSINESLINKEAVVDIPGIKKRQVKGIVSAMDPTPLSAQEAQSSIDSDFVSETLITAPFVYKVIISTDQIIGDIILGSLCSVTITTANVKPLAYISK